jgi:acyl-CoA thioester hydrolase
MAEVAMSSTPEDKPLYVHHSTVWFDELDMLGVLHNARYAIHVERAMTAWYHSLTGVDPSDGYNVVKHYEIEFLRPFTRERGELVVEVWLERLGNTSAVYAFRCVSAAQDGSEPGAGSAVGDRTEIEHARGTRTIVKVIPGELRPAPWTESFRALVGAWAGEMPLN